MEKNSIGNRVVKKIGSSYIVWFAESNRWIEFREPAWLVYTGQQKGEPAEKIVSRLSEKYGLPETEARRFYGEIVDAIRTSSKRGYPETPGILEKTDSPRFFKNFSTRYYRVDKKHFTIDFGSQEMEHYIHPAFAHLETESCPEQSPHFRIHSGAPDQHQQQHPDRGRQQQQHPDRNLHEPLRQNRQHPDRDPQGQLPQPAVQAGLDPINPEFFVPSASQLKKDYFLATGSDMEYAFNDPGVLKHRLYIEITSFLYGIPVSDFMCFIHASAVSRDDEAILFCSPSGSGKSTMAALLQLPDQVGNEISFMSDDFVPVDFCNCMAYPFPAALSLKKGSSHIAGAFNDPASQESVRSGPVHYLPPPSRGSGMLRPKNVKKIIFIKYDPQVSFKMEQISATDALSVFHKEAWINPADGHAKRFLDWFVTLEYFKLHHSDDDRAVGAIRRLFGL